MAESIDDVRGAPGEMSGIEDAELLAILGRLAAAEPTEGLIAAVGSETLGVSFEGWDKNVVPELEDRGETGEISPLRSVFPVR